MNMHVKTPTVLIPDADDALIFPVTLPVTLPVTPPTTSPVTSPRNVVAVTTPVTLTPVAVATPVTTEFLWKNQRNRHHPCLQYH